MTTFYQPNYAPGQCPCAEYSIIFDLEVRACTDGAPSGSWIPISLGPTDAAGELGSIYPVRAGTGCDGARYALSGREDPPDCTLTDEAASFEVFDGSVRNVSYRVVLKYDGLPDTCGLPSPEVTLAGTNTYVILPCAGGWSGCTASVPSGSPLVPGTDPVSGQPTLSLPPGATLPPGGAPFTISENGGPGSYNGNAVPPSSTPDTNISPGTIPGGAPPLGLPGSADDTSPGSKTITWSGTTPVGGDQYVDGTQPVSYTVTYDDGTQIVVPLTVTTQTGAPIVYRDNTIVAVDWTGTNTVSIYTTIGEVYYIGQPYTSVYTSPLFTQGSLAHLKRLRHLLVFMDNTEGMEVYLPGDERSDGVRGKVRQKMDCNFSIVYNSEYDGTTYANTYGYNNVFWEEPLYSNHESGKQLDNYVLLKEPLLGAGYAYQLVVWNADASTWRLAGYQIDAEAKNKRGINRYN